MPRSLLPASFCLVALFFAGCSAIEERWGPYVCDRPSEGDLSYETANGTTIERIAGRVCAIGWDGNYLVVQQNPNGDKSVTNYFIIDARRDSATANSKEVVFGPLSEAEFRRESSALNLPPFTCSMYVGEVNLSK